MKVNNERTENRQAFLTVEMEPEEMAQSLEESYRRLVKKANIPGFRKGKAPREVLERHVGREGILEDALNQIIPDAYAKAVQEQGLEAVAQPQIEIVQTDPVIFRATVPLMPLVELGDYHGIRVEKQEEEITGDKVDAVLDELRHQYATWESVDRAVDFGDMVVMDVESTAAGDPFINQEGAQYQVLRDYTGPLPGFSEQIAGMNKGEEKEFQLSVPEDYPREELAGKTASFKVKIAEVKEEKLPELNDEFAGQVEHEIESLDKLREEIWKRLKERAGEKANIDFEERVVQAAVDVSKVEFPPVMVETEVDRMLNEQARRMQLDEKGLEEYLRRNNKTMEQLHEEMHPAAEKRVASSLVVGKVAGEENIEVSDSEIDQEIERMAGEAGDRKDEIRSFLNRTESRDSVRQMLLTRKTLGLLKEIAGGEDIAEAKKKEGRKDD